MALVRRNFRMIGRERKSYDITLENFYAALHPDDVDSSTSPS